MTTAASHNDSAESTPPLVAGDRLSRDEFERRYHAMPQVKKAELIEGIVYMPSPVSHARHGAPHSRLNGWLFHFEAHTEGAESSNNATVRLDLDNEPQPDLLLRILPEFGGQSSDTTDGYIDGPPELIVEITASTAAYDLHDKKTAYRRNGVHEYLVWRVDDGAIDWFALDGGRYAVLSPGSDGIFRSKAFPGLWLDAEALLTGDNKALLTALDAGIQSKEHHDFVETLRRSRDE